MRILLGHPTGNQFFRHLLTALHDSGTLGAVATTLDARAFLQCAGWLLPAAVRQELHRRDFTGPWRDQLMTRPLRECGRLLSTRMGWQTYYKDEESIFSVDSIFRDFDRWLVGRLEGMNAVYAYEDGALAQFTRAATQGITRVYDLPIAYWETLRKLIAEEAERLPEWKVTLGGGIRDSPAKLQRKVQELELADIVVTPSRFVAGSMPAWAQNKTILTVPFGSPPPMDAPTAEAARLARQARIASGAPLRVLFAGSMGQRKGLSDLMAAVRTLGRSDVELVVMGSLQADQAFYQRACPGYIWEKGRPHAQVLELMRSCDVFCLPSIVEGRALVMQEAMSQGLPVIITPNTGGEDLVEEGRTGFLVPIRSPESIAQKLDWCADHRQEVLEMGPHAAYKAILYTWKDYGRNITQAIRDFK